MRRDISGICGNNINFQRNFIFIIRGGNMRKTCRILCLKCRARLPEWKETEIRLLALAPWAAKENSHLCPECEDREGKCLPGICDIEKMGRLLAMEGEALDMRQRLRAN